MKRFCCGDVVPGCTSTWTSRDVEGILGAVATHAAEAHGMTEVPTHVVDAVLANIRDVA